VLKPAERIPIFRDWFPRCPAAGSSNDPPTGTKDG